MLQESFHSHFEMSDHNGERDWEVRIIDTCDTTEELRKRESFWKYELDNFQPNGLNEKEVSVL